MKIFCEYQHAHAVFAGQLNYIISVKHLTLGEDMVSRKVQISTEGRCLQITHVQYCKSDKVQRKIVSHDEHRIFGAR